MTHARRIVAVLALCAALIATPTAQASPPPPPAPNPVLMEAACGADRTAALPAERIAVTLSALDPASLGFADGRRGALTWRWGVRLSSSDPRLHDVKGLELDDTFGLLAVTAAKNWLTFDLQGGVLDKVAAVGVASMRGAAAPPVSLAQAYGAFMISYAGARTVDKYLLKLCGTNAKALPVFDVPAAPTTLVVDGAYTYVGVVQPDGAEAASALELPYERHAARFGGSTFPPLPGHRLVGLSNPVKIVPDIVGLWAPDATGGEAVLQQVRVTAWDDVRSPGEGSHAVEIGRLPRTPTAFTSAQPRGGDLILFLAFDGPRPGVLDLYALTAPAPFN